MAIRKQIGWSQEANLMYNISLQLDRLIRLRTGIVPTTTTTTSPPPLLTLVFADASFPSYYVGGDPTDVNLWNIYFGLPGVGTPFTSVSVNGATVVLENLGSMYLQTTAFYFDGVLEIDDPSGIITKILTASLQSISLTTLNLPGVTKVDYYASTNLSSVTTLNLQNVTEVQGFGLNSLASLTNFYFPNLVTIGDAAFAGCNNVTNIYIPSCTSLGSTCGNNNVFIGAPSGVTITIPAALADCSGSGTFDEDILGLISPTIIIV
jgi:hypothetical protein